MSVQHNAYEVGQRMRMRAEAAQREMAAELAVQAQRVAVAMRDRVAKHRSHLVNSITVDDLSPVAKRVAPHMAHAIYVEKGVRPGGKGLPRFFDPAAADAVAWLRSKLQASKLIPRRQPNTGSQALMKVMLTLKDAYEGWAWHVRKYGVKAQPFVEPTGRELARPVAQALRQRLLGALSLRAQVRAAPFGIGGRRPA